MKRRVRDAVAPHVLGTGRRKLEQKTYARVIKCVTCRKTAPLRQFLAKPYSCGDLFHQCLPDLQVFEASKAESVRLPTKAFTTTCAHCRERYSVVEQSCRPKPVWCGNLLTPIFEALGCAFADEAPSLHGACCGGWELDHGVENKTKGGIFHRSNAVNDELLNELAQALSKSGAVLCKAHHRAVTREREAQNSGAALAGMVKVILSERSGVGCVDCGRTVTQRDAAAFDFAHVAQAAKNGNRRNTELANVAGAAISSEKKKKNPDLSPANLLKKAQKIAREWRETDHGRILCVRCHEQETSRQSEQGLAEWRKAVGTAPFEMPHEIRTARLALDALCQQFLAPILQDVRAARDKGRGLHVFLTKHYEEFKAFSKYHFETRSKCSACEGQLGNAKRKFLTTSFTNPMCKICKDSQVL